MATSSSNQSTRETENFLRLSALIVDIGTKVLRDVFDSIYPSATLAHALHKKQKVLMNLNTKNILTLSQWNDMFQTLGGSDCSSPHVTDVPRTGVSSSDFDVTLLSLLLSNICNLSPPPTGWGRFPPTRSQSIASNIIRLRLYRNDLYAHASEARISTASFTKHWTDIRGVLLALGPSHLTEIENLKTCDISCIQEQRRREILDVWCATDRQLQNLAESISESLDKYLLPTVQTIQSSINTIQSDVMAQRMFHERLTSDMKEMKRNQDEYQESNIEALSSIKGQIDEGVGRKLNSLEQRQEHFQTTMSNFENTICPVIMRIDKKQEEVEQRQNRMEQDLGNLATVAPTQAVMYQMFVTLQSNFDKALKMSSEGQSPPSVPKIEPVLNNMMKNTKLFISEILSHDATFVYTDTFNEAKALLEANRILILSGFPGEGKTTMATHLMLEMAKPERCLVVKRPGEWKYVNTDQFDIILFDDIFGKSSANRSCLSKWKSIFDMLWSHFTQTDIRFVFTSRQAILRQVRPSISSCDLMSKHFTKTLTPVSLSETEKLMMLEKHMRHRGLTISKEFLLQCIDDYHPLQGFPNFAKYFETYDHPKPPKYIGWSLEKEANTTKMPLDFLKRGLDELYAEDKQSFFGLAALWIENCYPFIEKDKHLRREVLETLATQWGIHPSSIDVAKNASLHVHDGGYVTKSWYYGTFSFAHSRIQDMVGLVLGKENPELVLKHCSDSFLLSYITTGGYNYPRQISMDMPDELFLKINESDYGCLVSCLAERIMKTSTFYTIPQVLYHRALHEPNVIDAFFKHLEQEGISTAFFTKEFSHSCNCYGRYVKLPLSVLSLCLYRAPPNVELAKRIISTGVMNGGSEGWVLIQKALALAFAVKQNIKDVYTSLLKDRAAYNYASNICESRFYLFQLLAFRHIVAPYPVREDALISQSAVCFAAQHGDPDLIKVLLRHLEIHGGRNVLTGGNNPLHMACKYNRLEVVRILLGTNLHLNTPNSKKYLPIHLAAVNKHAELVGLLLDFGFSADVRGGKLSKTPLHLAAGIGSTEIVQILLQQGASCYKRDKTSHVPLHYAAMFGHAEVTKILLQAGGVDQIRMKAYSYSKIIKITSDTRKRGRIRGVPYCELRQIRRAGCLGQDKGLCTSRIKGITPLHYAARKGHLEVVRVFLQMGADPNVVNSFRQTPLLLAASFGHIEVVSELCQVTSVQITQKHGFSPLHVAVYRGQTESVRCLLDNSNVDINETDEFGKSAVHIAAQLGFVDIVRLLIERECDWRMQTNKGDTVLHFCCRHRKYKLGTKDSVVKKHLTSTTWREESDHIEVARLFLRKDTGLANIRNKNGKTPFLEANLYNNVRVMELLIEFGLNIMDSSRDNDTFWQYYLSRPYLCGKC